MIPNTTRHATKLKRGRAHSTSKCEVTPTEPKLVKATRDTRWLAEIRKGSDVAAIAEREKLSRQLVQRGLTRARLRELADSLNRGENEAVPTVDKPRPKSERGLPRLVPLFPIGPFTPSTPCGHHHPIRAGSVFCCMVCHTSGMDDHPGLKRNPRTDPAPEPSERPESRVATAKATAEISASDPAETRKQRRRRQFTRPSTTVG